MCSIHVKVSQVLLATWAGTASQCSGVLCFFEWGVLPTELAFWHKHKYRPSNNLRMSVSEIERMLQIAHCLDCQKLAKLDE